MQVQFCFFSHTGLKKKCLLWLGGAEFEFKRKSLQANQSQLKPEQLLLFKTISKNVSQMRICLKTNCPARRMPQHCIMHFNQLNLKLFHFNRSYMVAEDWTRNVDKIKARTNSLSIKLIILSTFSRSQ
ncbi:hypothetical protein T4D_16653 [Trichinella pseudospiralis]|uniref:Uncharacterized protein n=1 Tax=Trichinella pseudospiralis TaxID=6337 RepID=A0A0V1FCE7_TRIPS|nr:hypothetical protein T4D_16653 [Trichinella pseudospiralis]